MIKFAIHRTGHVNTIEVDGKACGSRPILFYLTIYKDLQRYRFICQLFNAAINQSTGNVNTPPDASHSESAVFGNRVHAFHRIVTREFALIRAK